VKEGPAIERTRRYGPALLLLSWVPVMGDAFCAAAGFLRMPWIACTAAMAAGKLARYAFVAAVLAAASPA
jgi:membrane protein YqaA with SNARE-associated domain